MRQILRAAPLRLVLLGLLAGATYSAHDPAADGGGYPGLLGELARTGPIRVFAPRLSVPLEYRACSAHPPDEGTIPVTRCGSASAGLLPSREVLDLSARASAAVRAEVDPDALHAVALVEMLWAGDGGNRLHESISSLQTASRLTDRPAPVLADLAAAHLVRAERMQAPRDLLEAIEAADRAVELEPRNAAALFNLALALDRLGLDGEAAKAWREYLMVDSRSGWAKEAERRVQALEVAYAPPPPPAAGASTAEIEAYVARAPQEARLLGWDRLLGEWGEAVLAGDSARAEERLRLAGGIGEALERRGGDATLADAVRAIQAQGDDRAATRRLAEAHRDYAAGGAVYRTGDYAGAAPWFARVLASPEASLSPLRDWAAIFRGATLVYGREEVRGESLLAATAARADSLRHPALAGRVLWSLGTTRARAGHTEQALEAYRAAERLFARIGEREHLGAVHLLISEAEFTLGNPAAGHDWMHQALVTLRPLYGSVWLHNQLQVSARRASDAGLVRTALRLQDESVREAEGTGIRIYAIESLLARAQIWTARGDTTRAHEDLRAGRAELEELPHDDRRGWFEADLRMAEARLLVEADSRRAAAALDSVVTSRGVAGIPAREVPARLARAEAYLRLGDLSSAEADLNRAVEVLEGERGSVTSAALRSSLADAAQSAFDRVVMFYVNAGRTTEALSYLERGRGSFAPMSPPGDRRKAGRPSTRPGEVAVEYALIGDTLLTWTVSDTVVHFVRGTVNRAHLLRIVERVRSSLELQATDSTVAPDLALLYDRLIRPVSARLGPDGTPLLLVADGEIAGIPFAALWDARRRRYLVESHPIRLGSTLRDGMGEPRRRRSVVSRAVLVADPGFEPRDHPGLTRLSGAGAEVREIAGEYPEPIVLSGLTATAAALRAAMHGAEMIHYAGHAVFDDERPERSFLVLAPARAGAGSGQLSAAEIARLDLQRVRLVVLSACHTLRSRSGRSGGFAGLSGALMSAGADGVLGSLWRVDDQRTHALMVEFHGAYRRAGDGGTALRTAQLRLLRHPDPALRSPAAWAGFRYAGN